MTTPTSQQWNITRLLDWTAQYLAQKGVESPRLDAEVLLAHCLGWSRIDLYAKYDQTPSEDIRKQYKVLIGRRLEGCPVAYLVGRKEFFGLTLDVSPAVLIPRPESEYVVMECLRLAKDIPEPRVLDIGTGSGNLAVAVAHKHPGAQVTAIDVSSEALAVAKRNAERHKVSNRIQFLNGDLYEPLSEPVALATGENRFDFVLSNPPYIPQEELGNLPPGVRDYEPHLALDGGSGGFTVFDRLIADAPKYLKAGGYLIVEIGSPQEKPARERLAAFGQYELGETIRDGAGHPRVLRARLRG
ncbi:MAG TPA: peptide chain release factor N(5)-glutamine methyltransferase [Gemmataceae bacterium]|jgi:release factor glutamine methyltransferase|nr:peptide chain release factor N(5)-glutamine methyltransferase [Gemmataceae bacterium]